jgi:acetone carboxylase gamma subunit
MRMLWCGVASVLCAVQESSCKIIEAEGVMMGLHCIVVGHKYDYVGPKTEGWQTYRRYICSKCGKCKEVLM